MNHKEGHKLVEACNSFISEHMINTNLYDWDKTLSISYDDIDGHGYGFAIVSLYKSNIERHEGESELYVVEYLAESEEVLLTLDNNGYTETLTSLDQFINHIHMTDPNIPEETEEPEETMPFDMLPQETIERVVQLTKTELEILEALLNKALMCNTFNLSMGDLEDTWMEQISCKLDGSICLK